MFVQSLNEICESIFELLHTQIKMYGGDPTEANQHKPISSGDITIKICAKFASAENEL